MQMRDATMLPDLAQFQMSQSLRDFPPEQRESTDSAARGCDSQRTFA
jgi:hypothetical protein